MSSKKPSPGTGLWGALNARSYSAAKFHLEQGADPNENIAPYLDIETSDEFIRKDDFWEQKKKSGEEYTIRAEVRRYVGNESSEDGDESSEDGDESSEDGDESSEDGDESSEDGDESSEDEESKAVFTHFHLALFLCFVSGGSIESCEIVRLLLDHGADVTIGMRQVVFYHSLLLRYAAAYLVCDDECQCPLDFLVTLRKFVTKTKKWDPIIELVTEATQVASQNRLMLKHTKPVAESVVAAWNNQLLSRDFSDVLFVCPDGTELHAHKSTLAASSPYFRTYFLGPWGEHHKDGRWETQNSSTVMKAVLKFIYTGEMELSLDDDLDYAVDLLKVAHEYELASLLRLCEASIMPKVTPANIKDMLQLADLCGAENLLKACCSLVRSKPTEILMDSSFAALAVEDPDLWSKLQGALSPGGGKKRKRGGDDDESAAAADQASGEG